MAEHGKPVCLLARNKACVCNPQTVAECDRCGWEETEALRRRAAIRAGGARLDKATGKYCLRIRKERARD